MDARKRILTNINERASISIGKIRIRRNQATTLGEQKEARKGEMRNGRVRGGVIMRRRGTETFRPVPRGRVQCSRLFIHPYLSEVRETREYDEMREIIHRKSSAD